MASEVTRLPTRGEIVEQVLLSGDLGKLTPEQRVQHYHQTCESLGLNPLTKPFEYITLNGKLTLYALRACTDQLRSIRGVSVEDLAENEREGVYIVTAKVRDKDGRTDIAKGAVNISGLKGEALANAFMKAETKAKRRATLSICGLGWLDESEVDSIPRAVIGEPQRAPMAAALPAPSVIAPQPVEPPHDPVTGELGPHKIEVPDAGGGKKNWIAWGSKLIAALKASGPEILDWLTENEDALGECEKLAPKAYASIIGAYNKRSAELPPLDMQHVDATALT